MELSQAVAERMVALVDACPRNWDTESDFESHFESVFDYFVGDELSEKWYASLYQFTLESDDVQSAIAECRRIVLEDAIDRYEYATAMQGSMSDRLRYYGLSQADFI